MKRSPLKRRKGLVSRPRRENRNDPARVAWKEPKAGWCQCSCDRYSIHLERHHIVYEQHVRASGGEIWNLDNSILLSPACHAAHHAGQRRLRAGVLPDVALAFAVDLFGNDERAAAYVSRYYR